MIIRKIADVAVEGVSHNPEIKKQVFIKNGTIQHITNVSHATFLPGQKTVVHSHADMTEVMYVLRGTITFEIDGKTVVATSGTTIVIEPKEMHSLHNDSSANVELFYFGVTD